MPVVATLLAGSYFLAVLALPMLLPLVAGSAALAACALALTRRAAPQLSRVMLVLAAWLTAGFGGAWLLRSRPILGLGWIVLALFLAPLPLIPWLYARTFSPPPSCQQDGER